MRKMLFIATTSLLVAAGAAHANSNVPSWSPYAIMPDGSAFPPPVATLREGRAADTRRHAPGAEFYAHDWSSVGLPVGSSGDYSNYF